MAFTIIQSLLLIKEEEEESKDEKITPESAFEAGSPQKYSPKALYDVRPLKAGEKVDVGGKTVEAEKGQYLVRDHETLGDIKVVDSADVDATLEPVRDSEQPDAEGFILYRDTEEIEAIQYQGERFTFKDDWEKTVTVSNNDYLIRSINEPDSYSVLKPAKFKQQYSESK